MKTDIEIARSVEMRRITEIAEGIGITAFRKSNEFVYVSAQKSTLLTTLN